MLKIFGAFLIVAGCSSVGFLFVATHRRETNSLEQLICILQFMECNLQQRMLPLSELCREINKKFTGNVSKIFASLAKELDDQIAPNAQTCMDVALSKSKDIPKHTYQLLETLGRSLGEFDLEGQLKGIISLRSECIEKLKAHTKNQDTRLRSYQSLAICAGVAAAILLV